MDDIASEIFKPDMVQGYIQSLLQPIDLQEQANVGAAANEGDSAGFISSASAGSRVGMAESEASGQRESAISGVLGDLANRRYKERMKSEDRSFQDEQRDKTEQFQKSMEQLGYNFQEGQMAAEQGYEKQQSRQGMESGIASSLMSSLPKMAMMAAMA